MHIRTNLNPIKITVCLEEEYTITFFFHMRSIHTYRKNIFILLLVSLHSFIYLLPSVKVYQRLSDDATPMQSICKHYLINEELHKNNLLSISRQKEQITLRLKIIKLHLHILL